MSACELCDSPGGEILWQDERCRVLRVGGAEAAAFPGFCRVVWNAHVREMTDLAVADRQHLFEVLTAVETVVRSLVRPDKINLACLGNVVPHLHWHVIPRWTDDSHFPAPVWAAAARTGAPHPAPAGSAFAAALQSRLGAQS